MRAAVDWMELLPFLVYLRFNLDKKESKAGKRVFIPCSNLLLVGI